jgi:competence protein ComEA
VQGETRSTVLIWLVAAALAVFAGTRLLGGGEPAAAPVTIDGAPGSAGTRAAGARPSRESRIFVHVAGAVRRPGLIRVAADTRVATALERAGGPLPRADLTLVNLAAKVQDGQQIVVPLAGQADAGGPAGFAGVSAGSGAGAAGSAVGGAGSAGLPGAKIHLSTATVDQLDEIDGIGPELAGRIVEYRTEHGGFRSLEELGEVDGIGEKRLATLRDALQP